MTARRHAARVASPGMAYGTLRRDPGSLGEAREPAAGIVAALVAAAAQLRKLQAGSQDLGSDILGFQLELLEDDGLVLELLEAAGEGGPVAAVERVLGEQIADFAASDSERFAARAADIADLRDRLVAALRGSPAVSGELPEATILVAENLTPSRFLELDRTKVVGIVDREGSAASHVSLLARAEGIPMLVRAAGVTDEGEGSAAMLDGEKGELLIEPEVGQLFPQGARTPASLVPESEGEGPARLADGETVSVQLTVNSLGALDQAPPDWFDGIGLVRSELLVRGEPMLTDPERQAELYKPLFDWAGSRPVTIRLFDAGGDKPVPGLSPPADQAGSYGVRGARLLMQRKDVLRAQLGAILRAAEGRAVRVLVPMVVHPREMEFFRAELERAGARAETGNDQVMLGMMVETPAAALEIERFDADFFALGTNDLLAYTLGSSRDADGRNDLREMPRSVLKLVRRVIEHAAQDGRIVTLCGDVPPAAEALGRVFECGLRSLSVPPRLAPRIKRFIRTGQ